MKTNEFMRKNKGITLIALVVTIIVLLILAGVSIQMLTGQTGILKQAQIAREETAKGQIKEDVQREILEKTMEKQGEDITAEELHDILDKYFDLKYSGEKKDTEIKAPDEYTDGENNPWNAEDFPDNFPELHSKEGDYPFKLGDIYKGDLSTTKTGETSGPVKEKEEPTLTVKLKVEEAQVTGEKIPVKVDSVTGGSEKGNYTYTWYRKDDTTQVQDVENHTFDNLKAEESYTLNCKVLDNTSGDWGIGEIEILSFYIDDSLFRAVKGMTFKDWTNSSFVKKVPEKYLGRTYFLRR